VSDDKRDEYIRRRRSHDTLAALAIPAAWGDTVSTPIRDFSVDVDVYSVAYSPNGTRVLVGQESWSNLCDTATGALLLAFAGPWATYAATFSPDGSKVLFGEEGLVPLVRVRPGEGR